MPGRRMLHWEISTFPSDETSPVCEVLESKGSGVVVQIDQRGEDYCAVQPESHKPRQHYHLNINYLYANITIINITSDSALPQSVHHPRRFPYYQIRTQNKATYRKYYLYHPSCKPKMNQSSVHFKHIKNDTTYYSDYVDADRKGIAVTWYKCHYHRQK